MLPLSAHLRNLDPTLLGVELALEGGCTVQEIEDELLSAGDLDADFASAVWLYAWSRADGVGATGAGQPWRLARLRSLAGRAAATIGVVIGSAR